MVASKITIPIMPFGKKNGMQIVHLGSRTSLQQSGRYKQYERDCFPFLVRAKKFGSTPCNVCYRFYFKDKRRRDLANYIEAINDILVKYGIFDDDHYRIIVSHDGSRCYYDKEYPRTEIEISPIKEQQN